jgi:hypothetical protein
MGVDQGVIPESDNYISKSHLLGVTRDRVTSGHCRRLKIEAARAATNSDVRKGSPGLEGPRPPTKITHRQLPVVIYLGLRVS